MKKNIAHYFLIYLQIILILFIGAPLQYLHASITNPVGQRVDFTYDELSRRTLLKYPNGVETSYAYDAASQLLEMKHLKGLDVLSSYAYTYNKIGLRTSMTDFIKHNDGSTDSGLHEYGYDQINRLLLATHPLNQQTFNPAETFSYDPVGNRLSDINNPPPSYQYNQANRILEDATYTYTFDANGNLVTRTTKSDQRTTTYTYDIENQLTRIDFPDSTFASYRYDGLGRRFEKNVNGVITRYVYDNEDILLEYDGSNNLLARYTHGIGIDEPLIMERGGQSYFYGTDGLGSISQLTDSTGIVIQSYIYNSSGKIVKQTGSVVNPYAYTAREYDTESGLYYYRARYYDASIGRFLQEDPFPGFKEIPLTINQYPYPLSNPINFTDPSGQAVQIAVGGVIVFIGGVIGGVSEVLTKGECESGWAAFGRGFVSGAAGTFVGLITGNPYIGGAAAGATSNLIETGLKEDSISLSEFTVDTVTSALTAGLSSRIPGLKMIGQRPYLWKLRPLNKIGRNSLRWMGQEFTSDISTQIIDYTTGDVYLEPQR